jgi:RHH-type proline utilization regulon transcriptional repressor/proline dehydrogenase/delta 1-pyrroline-5-carboxylate dehydrogenase
VHPDCVRDASWLAKLPLCKHVLESAELAAARLEPDVERVRLIGSSEPALLEAAQLRGIHVAREPVLLAGRVELLHYFREQVLCNSYHRYGNLHGAALLPGAARPDEPKQTPR